jgi:hypothetical protein
MKHSRDLNTSFVKAYFDIGMSSAIHNGRELLVLALIGIIVAIAVQLAQPVLNDLTTGASPVISGIGSTLISYVGVFIILAYIAMLFALVYRAFAQTGSGRKGMARVAFIPMKRAESERKNSACARVLFIPVRHGKSRD